jgi:hypothetical protein
MKIVLIPFIFISVAVSAQKKEKIQPLLKTDTTKIYEYEDLIKIQKAEALKKSNQMPVVKPKGTSIYSGLKEPQKDNSKYKILNATSPEKSKEKTNKTTDTKTK